MSSKSRVRVRDACGSRRWGISLSARSFRLLSQLSNPSQVSSSAGRSAAASSSSSLETSGVSGTAAAAGTPTRRPRAGSRTGSGPVVDGVSPRHLLFGERRPVLKRTLPLRHISGASPARRRTECGLRPTPPRSPAALNPTSGRPEFACRDKSSFYRCAARRRAATNLASPAWASRRSEMSAGILCYGESGQSGAAIGEHRCLGVPDASKTAPGASTRTNCGGCGRTRFGVVSGFSRSVASPSARGRPVN